MAELAKPQAQCEPAAQFLILLSNLEWLDFHARLKIKACDVLFPGQVLKLGSECYEVDRRCGVTVYGIGFRTWLKLS